MYLYIKSCIHIEYIIIWSITPQLNKKKIYSIPLILEKYIWRAGKMSGDSKYK